MSNVYQLIFFKEYNCLKFKTIFKIPECNCYGFSIHIFISF